MNILLTNDDGIDSLGNTSLEKALSKEHKVFTFAPKTEKSGSGSALTIFKDFVVTKIASNRFVVDGFPVDCVNIGLFGKVIEESIDIVLSGINHGVNMGDDIYYSGTLGAARHAYVHGVSGIAVSTDWEAQANDYEKVAAYIANILPTLTHHKQGSPVLFNLNFPLAFNIADSIKWTKLGRRIYRDTYKRVELDANSFSANLGGSELDYEPIPGSDFEAFYSGQISITPIARNNTDYEYLKRKREKNQ